MPRFMLAAIFASTLALGVSTSVSAQDINCDQITGDEADQILAQDPSDPNNLDADNDGFPCEDNARSGGGTTAAAPAAPAAPAAQNTVASLPSTGVAPAALGAGGQALAALMLAGGFGVAGLRARRSA